jgi:hypothetical protein
MGLGHSPSIVVDGLVFYIDPNNPNCYPGFGNTLYNIVNTSIGGTFVGYTSNPIDNTETRSIFFDGTNDYIDFGSSSSLKLTDNFTLSAWVKSNVYGDRAILGNFGPSSNYSGFNFNVQPSGKFAFLTGSHPNATYLYADNTYNLNTWYHITGVRRNGTNYLYINGIAQTSTNTQIVATSAQNFYFGKWYSNLTDYYHSGQIGIVSLYSCALSASEILQNYNATKKKFAPDENIVTNGLALNIDPSKSTSYAGTGNTIYDLSGFGNTGTLSAGLTFSTLNGGSIVNDAGNKVLSYPSANFSTNNFTMEAWVSVKSYPGTNAVFISNRGTSDNGWLLDVTSNKKGRIFIQRDAGASYSLETINDLGLNKWTNLSVVRNGTNLSLYRDGVLQNSTTLPSNYNIQSAYANDYATRYFTSNGALDGNVSTIKYYNRALTQQEISQNYNATKKRFVNALPPVRNGLVMELDTGQRSSYPGTGNTWYDLSGNSLNGTLTNGPTFAGLGASSSIVFDRSNDYVLVGDSSLLSNFTGMTVEIIVKYTTTNDQIFVQKWNYALGNDGYTLELLSSAIVGACYSGGGSYLSTSVSNYPINNIYHIVFTLNGSTQTMYINGVLVATNSSGSVPITAGKNLMIGQRSSAGTYFGGNNYLTKFYNRGLSAYEIKQNFDFYRTRYNI